MPYALYNLLEKKAVSCSVPCRVDMGGTLDISSFFLPLRSHDPLTVNIALDLRTEAVLAPFDKGRIRIDSEGFPSAVVKADQVSFDHPFGILFAIISYFDVDSLSLEIKSASPVRASLGGSSSAAVAVAGALFRVMTILGHPMPSRGDVAVLAHAIEESVAGVPCGLQDQLAAAFGGVNAWEWKKSPFEPFIRRPLVPAEELESLNASMLLAYCGVPHDSVIINERWTKRFISGKDKARWKEIVRLTQRFASLLEKADYEQAGLVMNQETTLRMEMTPEVLDTVGKRLFEAAVSNRCGARFSGAGGGGCVWALGPAERIRDLRDEWNFILSDVETGALLDARADTDGMLFRVIPF